MCEPTTIAATMAFMNTAAPYIAMASTAVAAKGMIDQGNAEAAIAMRNSAQQETYSQEIIDQGREDSDRKRAAVARTMGTNKVAMAANGMDVGGAHALDILDDQKDVGEADAFAIRETSRRTANHRLTAAGNYRADAINAKSSAKANATQTILTGASKVGPNWAKSQGYP